MYLEHSYGIRPRVVCLVPLVVPLWVGGFPTVPRRSLAERSASRQVAGRPGGGNLGEHLHRLIGSTIIIPADWKDLPRSQWPRWVVNAVWPGLRGAWEQRQRLHVRGRRFEYRVTPKVVQQGQWEIAQVERRRRGRG